MKTLNRVYLIGSVGRDPEVKTTGGGTIVASLSLATSERFKDASGTWADKTEWHSLVAFARTAEVIRDYVKKGTSIHIEGRLQTRTWEKDSQKHYRTEIVIDNLILLGGGKPKSTESKPSVAPTWDEVGSADDDIPF